MAASAERTRGFRGVRARRRQPGQPGRSGHERIQEHLGSSSSRPQLRARRRRPHSPRPPWAAPLRPRAQQHESTPLEGAQTRPRISRGGVAPSSASLPQLHALIQLTGCSWNQ